MVGSSSTLHNIEPFSLKNIGAETKLGMITYFGRDLLTCVSLQAYQ